VLFGMNTKKSDKIGLLDCQKVCEKLDEWSIMGIATVISGKRQEMSAGIACPTPGWKMHI